MIVAINNPKRKVFFSIVVFPLLRILAIFCLATNLHAQSAPSIYTPNIIPPSPNAASLAKFTDLPVSTYSGTADVTVPIHSIEAKGISVPISLSYHTGGIRVREDAGWVGLGWSLNAGGCITRTVMDKDDFASGLYFTSDVPEINADMASYPSLPYGLSGTKYAYAFFCNYKVYTTADTLDYYHIFSAHSSIMYDMEPDAYSYNFPGHSGKFIITRDKKVITQKQENLKFEFDNAGASFTITDEQGNKYYFNDKEYSKPGTGGALTISSWYLTTITSQQKDVVNFNYTANDTYTEVLAARTETRRTGCGGYEGYTGTDGASTLYLNITLSSIDFTSGQLQFIFDSSRSDLLHGRKLNTIKIYSKSGSSLTYKKEEQFFYSYFNPTSTDTLAYKRLKLDSVREASNSVTLPAYSFTYITTTGPAKNSFSVDHWGFYNGASGNTSYIPNFNGNAAPLGNEYYLILTGANREADGANMQAFALQKVTYPTGGFSQFEYEPNYYDDAKSKTGPEEFPQYSLVDTTKQLQISTKGTSTGSTDFTNIFPNVTVASNTTNAYLSITFRAAGNAGSSSYHAFPGRVYVTFKGNTYDMSSSSLTCSGSVCTQTIPLCISPAEAYTYTTFIADTVGSYFQDITLKFDWKELQTLHYNSPILMAGGLRIKTVTDYVAGSTIAKKRKYEYYTGRLMSYPSYARKEPMWVSNAGAIVSCISLTQFGSSYTQLTSVATGNIVGYDSVAEYIIDPSSGTDIGKTVYEYINTSDTVLYCDGFRLPGLSNITNNLNGSLLRKTVYANNSSSYARVAKTENSYYTTNRQPYYSLKYLNIDGSSEHSNGTIAGCPADTSVQTLYLACFYPSIKSERILLDYTTETTYDQLSGNSLYTTKTFYYDNPIHYLPTRTKMLDSKGNKHVSYIKYPQDYLSSGYSQTSNTILDTIINKNMVGTPIEKRDSLYYAGSSTGYIAGAQYTSFRIESSSHVILPDKTYKLAANGPVTDFQPMAISGNTVTKDSRYAEMVSMDSYDDDYNIEQYTTADHVHNSFMWDYNSSYPVAQVKATTIANTAFTSFEAESKGGWTFTGTPNSDATAPTGTKVYNLHTSSISKTGLGDGADYIVSYWSKNGVYTVSGGTGSYITGKTIDGWTYYEHAITLTGATVTIGSTSTDKYIDEVRLYPKAAQMTTYTYEPLVGMTSQCDINNRITYYEYDGFSRLVTVRDQDKNIVKKICYSYFGQTACDEQPPNISLTYTNPMLLTGYTVSYTKSGNTTSFTLPATASGTLGTLPEGTYTVTISKTGATTSYLFSACSGLSASGVSATFNNVGVRTDECNNITVEQIGN